MTLQGNRDESCWSRGQAWLVYGYPIAYSYTGDEKIFDGDGAGQKATFKIVNKISSVYYLQVLLTLAMQPIWQSDMLLSGL